MLHYPIALPSNYQSFSRPSSVFLLYQFIADNAASKVTLLLGIRNKNPSLKHAKALQFSRSVDY